MEQRLKSMSLRQFRERAAEITEVIDISIRDRDGSFRVLGFYTPYATEGTGRIESVTLPPVELGDGGRRPIKTPEEAAAAVASLPAPRPYPKSAQAGRRGKH